MQRTNPFISEKHFAYDILNSASSSLVSSPSFFFLFTFGSGHTITQLVGLFVELAWPSSSLEETNTYGIDASSASRGKGDIMSIGVMSPARTRILKARKTHDYCDISQVIKRTLFRLS